MITAHSRQCGCPTRSSGNVQLEAVDVCHSEQWRHPTRSGGDGALKKQKTADRFINGNK
ncbi:MAG: hypothetical protein LBJ63_06225 [Prevotellaceae bacterium]|jgi:hypothetical protein|nr:hypothetical protein [Prevotellaceae bacterium]